eukprot:CAMPEP_0169440254 /NCGR_PEP_ID=MMETSP1042-20121227/7636_1 /TAXON_ID=464988 /ORGANISM="Hemiselmis andersenii, Strain CCMP1180" /LENGTH=1347 /DNA_ID=CAMNT_0009551227 /DNA_START=64 /DNA_END=4104 /DNA_ORIENTATION=-
MLRLSDEASGGGGGKGPKRGATSFHIGSSLAGPAASSSASEPGAAISTDDLLQFTFGISADELEELRVMYGTFDQDSDGLLSLQELKSMYVTLGVPRSKLKKRDLKQVMAEIDDDESGGVTFNEFLHMLLKPKPGSAAARLYSHTDVHATSIQAVLQVAVKHPLFSVITFVVIITNVILMAFRDEYCDASCTSMLDDAEIFFQIFFVVEIAMRIAAAGNLSTFFGIGVNTFDFFITSLTVVSQICQSASADADVVRMLRSFTAFRTLRLMVFNQTLRYLLLFTVASSTSVLNLLLFILVVLLVFTSVRVYLFQFQTDDASSADVFSDSIRDMFQVMTGDNWADIMMDGMAMLKLRYGTSGEVVAAVFYLVFFFFAQYIVVNLFIAVILESFDLDAAERSANRALGIRMQYDLSTIRVKAPKKMAMFWRSASSAVSPSEEPNPPTYTMVPQRQETSVGPHMGMIKLQHSELQDRLMELEMGRAGIAETAEVCSGVNVRAASTDGKEIRSSRELRLSSKAVSGSGKELDEEKKRERVIFFLDPESSFARAVVSIADHHLFEKLIFLTITFSCLFLALDSPDPAVQAAYFLSPAELEIGNTVCIAVFTFEFIIRALSDGILFTERAYFRSSWNIVDFLVLVISIVDLVNADSSTNAGSVRALRILRALRPLRVMKRNPGMRQIISALTQTLRPVFFVLLFMLFFLCCFAFIGMNIFGGKFHRCHHFLDFDRIDCVGAQVTIPDESPGDDATVTCLGCLMPLTWHTKHFNQPGRSSESFDTFEDASLTVFQISTNHFADPMIDGINVSQKEMAPEARRNRANAYYFFILVLLSAFFITNLVVAFIIDGFTSAHVKMSVEAKVAKAFRTFEAIVNKQAVVIVSAVYLPTNKISTWLRPYVTGRVFEILSNSCVFLNVLFMCLFHRDQTAEWELMIETQNTVFLFVLLLEVALVLTVLGLRNFLRKGWNVFDLAILLAGLFALMFSASPKFSQLVRCFRFLRVLRLFKSIKAIRIMLETLVQSIGPLANIILLLLLILSMFAIFAVQSFGLLRQGLLVSYEPSLGDTALVNFRTYLNSMRVFFQILMGDDWHLMMYDCMSLPPFCTPDGDPSLPSCGDGCVPAGDCGPGPAVTLVFWLLFYVLVQYIMMNIFIAAVLDLFANAVAEDAAFINTSQMERMASIWHKKRFGEGDAFLSLKMVKPFLRNVPRPLGFLGEEGSMATSVVDERVISLVHAEMSVFVAMRRSEFAERTGEAAEGRSSMGSGVAGTVGWALHNLYEEAFSIYHGTPSQSVMRKLVEGDAVSFDEVMISLLCWHAPLAIPWRVKASRAPVAIEAFRHAEAYVLKTYLERHR